MVFTILIPILCTVFLGFGFENIRNISTHTFGIFPEDNLSFILILHRMSENILGGHFSTLWDGGFFYPYTQSLALSENMMFSSLFYQLFNKIFNNPIMGLNGMIALFLYANYLSMYFFLTEFFKKIPSSFGAAVFAYSMLRMGKWCHIHLFPQFFFPLLALFLVRYEKTNKLKWLMGMAGCIVLQFYFSMTLGLILTVSLIPYAIWKLFSKKTKANYKHLAYAVLLMVVTLLPVLGAPYLINIKQGYHRKVNDAIPFSANPKSYLVPPLGHRYERFWVGTVLRGEVGARQEKSLFVGFLVLGLLIFGAQRFYRENSKYRFILFMSFAFCLFVSFGMNGGLYHVLFYTFPGLQGFRTPARFGMTYLFFAAFFCAYALQRLSKKQIIPVAVFCFAFFIYENSFAIPTFKVESPFSGSTKFLEGLNAKEPVFYYPLLDLEQDYMYQSVLHGHPIGNGLAGYVPPIYSETTRALRDLVSGLSRETIQKLKSFGFRYVVYQKAAFLNNLKPIYSDNHVAIIKLD